MAASFDKDEIKRSAAGRWPVILNQLGGCPSDLLDDRHHPCPKCGGTDRFRAIDMDAGALRCNHCLTNCGDGIGALRWLMGWDFPTALAELAKYLGVQPEKKPAADSKKITSRDTSKDLRSLPWDEPHERLLRNLWLPKKRGVTREAMTAFGAELFQWFGHKVIGLPVYSLAESNQGKIVGRCIYRLDGNLFPKTEKFAACKTKMLGQKGQIAGGVICSSGTFKRFFAPPLAGQTQSVWKVEGPTDALALFAALAIEPTIPPEEKKLLHLVVTNPTGANEKPRPDFLRHFAGRRVSIIHDADRAGVDGADRWAAAAFGVEGVGPVRIVRLPYAVKESHGKDLRDWLNGVVETTEAAA